MGRVSDYKFIREHHHLVLPREIGAGNHVTAGFICRCGTGASDLITIRGARLLRHADVVVYAGSLADRELVRCYAANASVYDSAGMTLDEVMNVIMDAVPAGKKRGAPSHRGPFDLRRHPGTDGGPGPSGRGVRGGARRDQRLCRCRRPQTGTDPAGGFPDGDLYPCGGAHTGAGAGKL